MNNFRFVVGMQVAHISELKLKLVIKEVKWRSKKDSDGNTEKYFDGVIVNWGEQGFIREGAFHAGVIVPWNIAKMGEQVASEWLYENNKPLYKKVNEMETIANNEATKILERYETT